MDTAKKVMKKLSVNLSKKFDNGQWIYTQESESDWDKLIIIITNQAAEADNWTVDVLFKTTWTNDDEGQWQDHTYTWGQGKKTIV